MKQTLRIVGVGTTILTFFFGLIPLIVSMANASSLLANLGAIVVMVIGTFTSWWISVTLLTQFMEEKKE